MKIPKDPKQRLYYIVNLLLLLFIGFTLYRNIPIYYKQYKMKDSVVYQIKVKDKNGVEGTLPHPQRKQMIVFWATNCKPCNYELGRLHKAVESGEIKAEDINIISVMEDPKLVSDTVTSRGYKFNSFSDESGDASAAYEISVTPTVYLVDAIGKIHWVTSGISPMLISRAKEFFKE